MDQLQCSICGRTYCDEKIYEKHIKGCIDVRTYKCEQCDKEFVGNIQFINHRASHKVTCCKLCGVAISLNSRTCHKAKCSGNKEVNQLKCNQCPYETSRKANLNHHIQTHISKGKPEFVNKPVQTCVHCRKTFKSKKLL